MTSTQGLLQGLVDSTPITSINYLTHNRQYEDTQGNAVLAIEPPVVHFAGLVPGSISSQRVRLVNRSTRNTRIHVVPPSSSCFKLQHRRPPASLAPGMSEELVIEFCSDQARYHYDSIRIQTPAGNLVLPIHAYPLPNQPTFPKRVDLGRVALGDTISRTVQLSCRVPIDVGYTLSWQPEADALSISPASGTIPAGEAVELEFSYTPTSYTTQRVELKVCLEADNAQPLVCEVTASCAPGVARDTLLQQTAATSVSDVLARSSGPASTMVSSSLPRAFNKGGGSPRGGAGGGDAYTLQQYDATSTRRTRDCRVDGPLKAKLPAQRPKLPEVQMQGTLVPKLISSHTDVNYVLTQQPGKLRTQDIKAAIAQRRAELAADTAALEEVLAEGAAAGVHPFNQPGISAGVKEALFQLELQKVAAAAKRSTGLVGRDGGVVGEDPPTPEQVATMQAAQQAAQAAHQQQLEQEAAHRLEPDMQVGGALHVLPAPKGDASAAAATSTSTLGLATRPAAAAAAGVGEEYPGLEGWQPHWVLLEANTWRKRVGVLQRFVAAARVVILRNRAERRLTRLRALAAQLGAAGGADALAGAAVQEVVLEASLVSRPGAEPRQLLLPERVLGWPLPLYRPEPFAAHPQVGEAPEVGEFTELIPAALQSEYEYKLLGYTPEDFPGWINYMPPLEDQPLLELAPEEAPGARPACVLPPALAAVSSSCPDASWQMPYVSLEVGNRYAGTQAQLTPTPSWGLAPPHRVQPRQYPHHDSCAGDAPASCSLRGLAGAPQLSDRWTASKPPWRVLQSQAPEPMSGPEAAHLLPSGVEDADKPQVALKPPTDLSGFLGELPDGVVPQPGWVKGGAAAADGQAAASEPTAGMEADGSSAGKCLLPHERHVQKLNAEKDDRAGQQLQQLVRSVQEHNARLSRQHRQAVQL